MCALLVNYCMGQAHSDTASNTKMSGCGLNCFFKDVNKENSDKIDKLIAKEKLYFKRQVCYFDKKKISCNS